MIFRRPLHELAAWPAADVALLNAYIERRPPAAERLEAAFARFCAMWVASKQGSEAEQPKPGEFLTFTDPWPEPTAPAPSVFAQQRAKALSVFRNLSARLRR